MYRWIGQKGAKSISYYMSCYHKNLDGFWDHENENRPIGMLFIEPSPHPSVSRPVIMLFKENCVRNFSKRYEGGYWKTYTRHLRMWNSLYWKVPMALIDSRSYSCCVADCHCSLVKQGDNALGCVCPSASQRSHSWTVTLKLETKMTITSLRYLTVSVIWGLLRIILQAWSIGF